MDVLKVFVPPMGGVYGGLWVVRALRPLPAPPERQRPPASVLSRPRLRRRVRTGGCSVEVPDGSAECAPTHERGPTADAAPMTMSAEAATPEGRSLPFERRANQVTEVGGWMRLSAWWSDCRWMILWDGRRGVEGR